MLDLLSNYWLGGGQPVFRAVFHHSFNKPACCKVAKALSSVGCTSLIRRLMSVVTASE